MSGSSVMVMVKPRVQVARILSRVGNNGNAFPFRGETNTLYIQIVLGGIAWAKTNGAAILEIMLPKRTGGGQYQCDTVAGGVPGGVPNDLELFQQKKAPTGMGTAGGDVIMEGIWTSMVGTTNKCQFAFQENMILFANTSIYIPLKVKNT